MVIQLYKILTVNGVTWFKEDSYKNTAYHKLYEAFAKASKKQINEL